MSAFVRIPATGVSVRATEVGVPTVDVLLAALDRDDTDAAAELFDYLLERELHAILTVYYRWIPALIAWLTPRTAEDRLVAIVSEALAVGTPDESLPTERHVRALVVATASPNATDPERRAATDAALGAERIDDRLAELERAAEASMTSRSLGDLVDAYRVHHDRLVRATWALMTVGQREHGEEGLAALLRESVSGPMVRGRTTHAQLAEMTGEQIMLMTAETMRSHFSGAGGRGAVDITEEVDRYVLAFDPCGSAGRARREVAGSEHLLDSESARVAGAHPWTWGERDVCVYCAHCSFVNEILPIESVGFPKRVTQYPREAGDRCRWIIYRDPAQTPPEYFDRVGQSSPERSHSRAVNREPSTTTEENS